MRRNPVYAFKNRDSVGIFEVPLNATVHILDGGSGTPEYVEIIDKTGLSPNSTIGNFLDDPNLYIDLANSIENFVQLHDTPDTYANEGNKLLAIDSNETGISFIDTLDGGEFTGTQVITLTRKSKDSDRIQEKTKTFSRKPKRKLRGRRF